MGLIKRVLFRHSRPRIHQKSNLIIRNSNALLKESIAKSNNGDHPEAGNVISHQTREHGVVRMKILVGRQDLKQVLEVMMNNNNEQASSSSVVKASSLALEQRLSVLRKKQILRAKQSRQGSWSPALQSIPEEF